MARLRDKPRVGLSAEASTGHRGRCCLGEVVPCRAWACARAQRSLQAPVCVWEAEGVIPADPLLSLPQHTNLCGAAHRSASWGTRCLGSTGHPKYPRWASADLLPTHTCARLEIAFLLPVCIPVQEATEVVGKSSDAGVTRGFPAHWRSDCEPATSPLLLFVSPQIHMLKPDPNVMC